MYFKGFLAITSLLFFTLSFSQATTKHKQVEEEALSSFPKVLDNNDIKTYKQIIKYQKIADWDKYKEKVKKLNNKILVGYFHYDMLMHPNKYRASYEELYTWLNTYDDYPVVMRKRAHKLMLKRAKEKKQIVNTSKPNYGQYLRGYGEVVRHNKENKLKATLRKKTKKDIEHLFKNKFYDRILKYNNNTFHLKDYKIAQINNNIKKVFLSGNIFESNRIYEFFYKNLDIKDRDFLFTAGINAFRVGDHKRAIAYFNSCNEIKNINKTRYEDWHVSGCLYWYAKVDKNNKIADEYLRKASLYPRTLYGQLSLEKLNLEEPFVWDKKFSITTEKIKNITKYDSFLRVVGLSQLNLYDKGDLELRNLYGQLKGKNNEVLYFISETLNLAAVQMRLGEKFREKDESIFIRGLYPTPIWEPYFSEYIVDKALIMALIRRESAFNIKAKSAKGARGLMQLMPRTASKIHNDHRLRYGHIHKLYSLKLNLDVGQKFLNKLLKENNTNRSILDVLIAYNAGIKRLKGWDIYTKEDDPLAFIESIPIKETRWFVKNILTDLWIYRDKLGQEKPSRRSLASDVWPKYKKLDYIYSRDAKLRLQ